MRKIKMMIIAILMIVLTTNIGCGSEETANLNKPEFKTVVMYEEFEEYIKKSKEQEGGLATLYQEIILEPVFEDFVSGGEYSSLASTYIGKTIRQLDDLEIKLDLLKDNQVEEIVNGALINSSEYLSGVDTTVYIFPSTIEYYDLTNPLGGVGGCTLGSGKILISVDPTVEGWESILTYTVAHEYHHSVWTSRQVENKETTLLDYLTFEGRADSFAARIYSDIKVPWTSSIDLEVERYIWDLIKNEIDSNDAEILYTVMFGGVNGFPHWSGYTIGYNIVQDFLKNNPEISFEELTDMEPNEILDRSNYEERF